MLRLLEFKSPLMVVSECGQSLGPNDLVKKLSVRQVGGRDDIELNLKLTGRSFDI